MKPVGEIQMNLAQKFAEGGIFMYFILVFGICTLTLIAERMTALFFKTKEAPEGFRKALLESIRTGNLIQGEQTALAESSKSALGRVAWTGWKLRTSGSGDEELQARMDEALSAEISTMDRRTGFLAMFGNVATLLGLLGTITGMIHSFAAVASANPADRATMLSKGISEAMNCTAFGLVVAIPALVLYAVLQNKTDRMISKLTEETSQLYHDLVFLVAPQSVARTGVGATHASPPKFTNSVSATAPGSTLNA